MLRVEGVGQMPLRGMTAAQCREILHKAFGKSVYSYRKGRVILHSIFAYGIRQEWCDFNPVDRIDNPEVSERSIAPLNQEEVMKLNSTAATRRFKDMRFSLSLPQEPAFPLKRQCTSLAEMFSVFPKHRALPPQKGKVFPILSEQ